MTNAWTPGPWVVHRGFPLEVVPVGHQDRSCGGSVYEDDDRERFALRIAKADCDQYSGFAHEIPHEQAKANARLIAAAPDMAEALESFIGSWDAYGEESSGWSNDPTGVLNDVVKNGFIAQARAALAKARGAS